jgi:hypothetical protein
LGPRDTSLESHHRAGVTETPRRGIAWLAEW